MNGSIGIIGGGLIGLATALAIQEKVPGIRVTVMEKEDGPARHQSGHNSGVLHAGLYYRPGSLKAKMAVAGIRKMAEFCQQHGVPHERCGKLVVAVGENEVARLRALHERGKANGLSGLSWLGVDEMREREPAVAGTAALLVPEEGIVDFPAVAQAMVVQLEQGGGAFLPGCKVSDWTDSHGVNVLRTSKGELPFDFVVNCAGLFCDRIARRAGLRPAAQIVPFRGEYFVLRPAAERLVRHLIYPVPDPQFPFLGVHFTRMIRGGVEAGPNAVLATAREGYTKFDVSLRDCAELATFPGLWRFAARYPAATISELASSFSRRLFVRRLQRLVPAIQEEDLAPGGAGVRAQAMTRNGDLVEDFSFLHGRRQLHILNAPSPGATAALAIGEHVAGELVSKHFSA